MVELLATDTGVVPFFVAGDSVFVEHSALLGHTAAVTEPLGSRCTTVAVQTAAVVQHVSLVVMK